MTHYNHLSLHLTRLPWDLNEPTFTTELPNSRNISNAIVFLYEFSFFVLYKKKRKRKSKWNKDGGKMDKKIRLERHHVEIMT